MFSALRKGGRSLIVPGLAGVRIVLQPARMAPILLRTVRSVKK